LDSKKARRKGKKDEFSFLQPRGGRGTKIHLLFNNKKGVLSEKK